MLLLLLRIRLLRTASCRHPPQGCLVNHCVLFVHFFPSLLLPLQLERFSHLECKKQIVKKIDFAQGNISSFYYCVFQTLAVSLMTNLFRCSSFTSLYALLNSTMMFTEQEAQTFKYTHYCFSLHCVLRKLAA